MTAPEIPTKSIGWVIAAAVAAAAVFVIDLFVPLGIAVPMLYVLPILLTWLAPGLQSTVPVSGAAIAGTWVKPWLSTDEFASAAFANRTMVSVLLLVVAGLLAKQKQVSRQVADALEARRQSEAQLRLFVEHAPAAIAMLDARMCYMVTSRRWLADYGLVGQNLPGRSHYDVFPGIEERWKQVYSRCLAGAVERSGEDMFVRADGSRQWLRWEVRPWYTASDTVGGIVIFTEDITERKRVEQELHDSQELPSRIIDSLSAHVAVLDKEGTIIAINDAWKRFALSNQMRDLSAVGLGVNYLETCRRSASVDAQARDVLHGIEAVYGGLRPSFEAEYPCHSPDEHRWFVVRVTPLSGLHGGLVVAHENVSARKQAEEALRDANAALERRVRERTAQLAEANERWGWVMRATHDGVWDWDLVHGHVYFSPRRKEMHKFDERDRPESSEEWSNRIHPDDQARVREQLEAYWKQQVPEFWEEYRIQRKDGTWMWVLDRGIALFDEQGRAVRMVGAETDITWRKEAEEAMRRRKHEFRTLADNVPAFFSYVNRDRRYRFVNKQHEKLFQRPSDQIVGSTMQELLGTEGYTEVERHLDAAFCGQEVSFEYRLPGPGAGERWFSARYVPDRDEQGRVVGLFVLLADVTKLKLSEADLREKEHQLRDLSARLLQAQEEERRRIAQELHDDFAQRLASLAIDLHTVQRGCPGLDPMNVSRIQQMGDSAERLATDLQQVAHQLHPSILEHVGLEAAVREQVDEFAIRTGLKAEIIVRELPHAVPREKAICLYRVLQESLRNVQKHAGATHVLVRFLQTARGVGLCVHDDGRGIENLEGTARRKGLGLTSMEERVRALQGTFRIKAKPGDGTEIRAWVPLEDVKGES